MQSCSPPCFDMMDMMNMMYILIIFDVLYVVDVGDLAADSHQYSERVWEDFL